LVLGSDAGHDPGPFGSVERTVLWLFDADGAAAGAFEVGVSAERERHTAHSLHVLDALTGFVPLVRVVHAHGGTVSRGAGLAGPSR
jgi:hypothetical protein